MVWGPFAPHKGCALRDAPNNKLGRRSEPHPLKILNTYRWIIELKVEVIGLAIAVWGLEIWRSIFESRVLCLLGIPPLANAFEHFSTLLGIVKWVVTNYAWEYIFQGNKSDIANGKFLVGKSF